MRLLFSEWKKYHWRKEIKVYWKFVCTESSNLALWQFVFYWIAKKLSLCCLSACANFTNKKDGIGRGSKTRASQQRLAVSLNLYKI